MGQISGSCGIEVALPLPSVAVIVPTYRRPDELRACMAALGSQVLGPDEIVVVARRGDVDSAGAVEALRDELPVRVVFVDSGGQVAALNAGVKSTRADVLAFTDDDCRPQSDWIERIAAHFAHDPGVGAVGGRDIVHEGEPRRAVVGTASRVGRVTWFGRPVGFHHFEAPCQDVDYLKGANMAIRRTALVAFDSRLRGSGAEVCNDMAATLGVSATGKRVVWDPAVAVDHYPAQRFDVDTRSQRALAAIADDCHNEIYVLGRWLRGRRRIAAVAYALLMGRHDAPGLVAWPVFLARGGQPRRVLEATGFATWGRLGGLRTLVRRPAGDR